MVHGIHTYKHQYHHRTSRMRMARHVVWFIPTLLIIATGIVLFGASRLPVFHAVEIATLLTSLAASFARLLIAYILSLAIGIPLALIAEGNKRVESILLPIYDVLESMPILAFFPVIIIFFVQYGWIEAAAIFIIFFNMLWNIVFNLIGGLKVIPRDIFAVAKVFGFTGLSRFTTFTLPALFPPLTTGTILAFAEGWNMLIVAEVLHAYAPQSVGAHDLFGIGSVLVSSANSGDTATFLAATIVILVTITIINLFVWQPLLTRSEKYKFE